MNAKTTKITKTLSGGQAAVEALRNEKTEYVFGLIGSATMEMFDALYDADDIKFIHDAGFNGVAIASLFHYEILQIMKSVNHAPGEGNFTFTNQLNANPISSKITKEINTLKNELLDLGIPVRL